MAWYTDAHGVEIYYEKWDIANPKAIIQLAHGVGEHLGRYREVGAVLNTAGYSVWADDHRGHGQTGKKQWGANLQNFGHLGPGGLRATIESVQKFTSLIVAKNPGVPIVFLGHSWGSLLGQIILNMDASPYVVAIFTGTAYRSICRMNPGDLNRRFRHLGTSPVEWLSRDPQVAKDFMADPLTTAVPLKTLFGTRDAIRLFGRPAKDIQPDIPILIMVGNDDPLGGRPSAEKLADSYRKRSGLKDVTLKVYPEARHELFNEINKAEVFQDLTSWLDARVSS